MAERPDQTSDPSAGPPAHEAAERRDWVAYFDRMEGKPPRDTLRRALDAFANETVSESVSEPRLAIDLGCGAGRDTQLLLESGWRVLATDGHADGIRRLRERKICREAEADGRLEARVEPFERADLPTASLVNASFSLPFCPPAAFEGLWARIDCALGPGDRFAGQFFGDRDDWAIIEDRTHLSRDRVLSLFDRYVLEYFQEEDRPSKRAGEHHKHWHVFHVVARKRNA